MGFFGGGYNKPGKGVDKNAPKKKGFFLFWDIIFSKFVKFIETNSLYSAVSLIWIVLVYFVAAVLFSGHIASLASSVSGLLGDNAAGTLVFGICSMFAVGVFLMWGSGPASAAYSYIMRCFTRGEHAWILGDGKDKFKENFKQGMIVVIVDFLVLILGINALYFYYSAYVAYGSVLWLLLCYIAFLLLFIYTMIHPYIYQLMVTFKCSVWELYKNAVLLTLANLPLSFILTLIEAVLIFAVFTIFSPAIAILFSLILGPCIMRFPTEFYAARVIERSLLKDMQKKNNAVIEYIDEEPIMSDEPEDNEE